MKKNLKKFMQKKSVLLLKKIAVSNSKSACLWGTYQPKEPKCLQKK
jgi:cyclic lactone autoinducer peptide